MFFLETEGPNAASLADDIYFSYYINVHVHIMFNVSIRIHLHMNGYNSRYHCEEHKFCTKFGPPDGDLTGLCGIVPLMRMRWSI